MNSEYRVRLRIRFVCTLKRGWLQWGGGFSAVRLKSGAIKVAVNAVFRELRALSCLPFSLIGFCPVLDRLRPGGTQLFHELGPDRTVRLAVGSRN